MKILRAALKTRRPGAVRKEEARKESAREKLSGRRQPGRKLPRKGSQEGR
jgi:hypothetical protein